MPSDVPTEVTGVVDDACRQFERVYIPQALREHDGQVHKTADALAMNRSPLWRKMKKYDLAYE